MRKLPTFVALAAVASMTAPIGVGSAAVKCEIHTRTCIDGRTGQARVCITTICRNDDEIVSIDTIVLKDGDSESPQHVKPKLPKSSIMREKAVK